jgi:DNA polymerase-3 subunit alpha
MKQFTHLHLHTHYSLLDGMSRMPELMDRAKELGFEAIALTDHGVLYGAIEFYEEARSRGIKPIIGCEVYVATRSRFDKEPKLDDRQYHLTLLAKNNLGYSNLVKLATQAQLEGFYYKPRVDHELLEQFHEGLICLSGCPSGEIPRALQDGNEDKARELALRYRDLFGPENFYIEIQDHGMDWEQEVTGKLIALARDLDLPLVATNDGHYTRREDAEAHDVLLCIQTNSNVNDSNRMRMETEEFCLRSADEMWERFGHLPEALTNTMRIAEQCNVELALDQRILPHFEVPAGHDARSYLHEVCTAGLETLYPDADAAARERLEYELDVIGDMGFSSYLLIAADFVNWAKEQGIPTTVRGSAAGSLVCYTAGITDIDPLHYGLIFERFLNPSRYTMPDIDVDLMDVRRDEVIEYVTEKYGADHVAQIITFGTMKARAAVRDVGRALGMTYGEVDRVAKLVPIMSTVDDALRESQDLQQLVEEDPQVQRLLDLAKNLEGVARHASTHAAGVVISREPLTEYVPLQKNVGDDGVMTQFEMNAIEKIGLLKMDFLGLRNLTVLDRAVRFIGETRGETIDLKEIPLDDSKTFELLSSGETTGIFQLESDGMRRHVKELQPDRIEDVMALVALYRPGPMAYIPQYIARRHGREQATARHPLMAAVLERTYGIMVYQEDVMAVAQAVAGYTLAEADKLCYAVRKKIAHELQEHRERFVQGAVDKGLTKKLAEEIFDDFEPFARYGFNQAHATCYGTIAYQTAYLKANYPTEYMTAVLSTELGNTDKIIEAVRECGRLEVTVAPPNVNESESNFAIKEGTIYFGLAAVKNVGAAAAQAVAAQRGGEPYQDFYDFCMRIDQRVVNKRALESLIKVGALDTMGDRAALLASVDEVLASTQKAQSISNQGPTLFETFLGEEQAAMFTSFSLPDMDPATPEEKGIWEKELLGDYLSENPFKPYSQRIRAAADTTTAEITQEREGKRATLAGRVGSVRKIFTRKGQNMAMLTLEDEQGQIDVTVFPKLYAERSALLANGNFIVVRGRVEQDSRDDVLRILAERVEPLDEAAAEQPGAAQPAAANGDPAAKVSVSAESASSTREDGLPDWVPVGAADSAESSTQADEAETAEDEGEEAAVTHAADSPAQEPDDNAAQEVQPTEEPVELTGPEVELVFQRTTDDSRDLGQLQRLAEVLSRNPGDTRVALRIILNGVHVRIATHDLIALTPKVEDEIEMLLGTAPIQETEA